MVKVKQIPEDFIVEEIFEKQRHENRKEKGFYVWFTLKKKNWDTFSFLKTLSRALGVSIKRFGYAGVKDRKAITYQKISVWNVPIEKLKKVKIKDIQMTDFQIKDERINIGDLKGNKFTVTIRDIDRNHMDRIKKNIEALKKEGFVNLFGGQRFGSKRMVTHLVGREIVKGNLKQAVWLYLTKSTKEEPRKTRRFRFMLKEGQDLKQALKTCPKGLRIEKAILNHLISHPNDYAGALRKVPKKLRKMFVHAYQAYLWNKIAGLLAESVRPRTNIKIPMVGFGTDLKKYTFADAIEKTLKEELISPNDFLVKRMPELASEGDERDFLVFPKDLSYIFERDELNEDKMKCVLKFKLPKGSYATVLLDEVIK